MHECVQRVPGNPGQMRLFALVNQSALRGRQMNLVEVNGYRNMARLIAHSAVQVCASAGRAGAWV